MSPRRVALAVSAALAVLTAGFAAGLQWNARPPAFAAAPVPAAREPGVVRFAPGSQQLAMLSVKEVREHPLPLAEPLNAKIVYDETRTARVASPIAGRIVALRAGPGDRVAAGQTLALIDAPDLGAALADLAKAKADEQHKEFALARARELLAGEVLARRDFEAAQADFSQAHAETVRAALRASNLNPRRAALNGEQLLLSSPIAGIVAERRANPDLQVRPDLPDPLFVVTDLEHLQAQIDLPEQHLASIAPGQPVEVEVDAYPGRRFPGRIERIAPVVDPATRRVQVRAALQNSDGALRPEMYARATLLADHARTAVRVPNSALLTLGLEHVVFVERAPGEFVRRAVQTAIQDRDDTFLAGGLAQGERVVVSGAMLLESELAIAR